MVAKPNMGMLRNFMEAPPFPAKCARIAKDAMGVELEMEFMRAPHIDSVRALLAEERANNWNITKDGSLRGHGYEFISKPLTLESLLEDVQALFRCLGKVDAKIAHSHRTSTHVHINFSKNTLLEVYQFLLLYYFLEPTLFCLTEEDRWHNTFCVASETTASAISAAANRDFTPFWMMYNNAEQAKYASLNLVPYTQLGTLESRIYHGAEDVDDVCKWITALYEVKQYAVKFGSIKALYKKLEDTDFKDLLKEVFVTTHAFVVEHIAMREKRLYHLANEGNSRAYPLVAIEKRLAEANDFFMEERKRLEELMAKQKEKEFGIEDYIIIDDVGEMEWRA